ncbi:MAG TPA: TRAP transporter small permease [Hydrogenophaga sp.]|uniref:TRAP transporter small permease subunit n=1 Tax=Hydrogenophaga sp. TaxID=1904254 RepID=UPI002BA274FD|nr:TRAP transporter small permease [Hydrogenophaga sp.]HSX94619.1 TRAP transporter small permease [Hydrogenophaga sp.]
MSFEANTNLEEAPVSSAPSSPFGHVVDALNGLGSIVIALVMVLMCADVFMRNAFNQPLDGVAEMVAASIIVIVFLQLPATLRHGRMSRADLFLDPFLLRRPRAGRRLRALFSLVGIFACGVIAYATWPLFQRAWANNEFFGVEGVFTFPTWPMRIVVFTGAALAAVQYALLAWQDWRESAQGGAGKGSHV